jgi:hypothetical protein
MGWRFRKSFSPLPGIRLNFSPRGISTSVGVGPLRFYVGGQGAAVTARVPGSGVSFRAPLTSPRAAPETPGRAPPSPGADPAPDIPPLPSGHDTASPDFSAGEIRSASTATLTSAGLGPVKELVLRAQEERGRLLPELRDAEADASRLRSQHERWKNGWLFRHLFKTSFARLGERAAEATAKEAELQEQERLSRLATEFDLPEALKDYFGQVCDAAARLAQAQRVWDTVRRVATDQYRQRTAALEAIVRRPVEVSLGTCDLIQSAWKVPHLPNANGGELFLYPGFILYRVSDEAFALIDVRDVTLEYTAQSFIEEEAIPEDSQVVGQAWKKANKDGSPDRRFADNHQIPIVAYGGIRLTSESGLNEEYMVSNAAAAQGFAKAWALFKQSLPKGNAQPTPEPGNADPPS